MVIVIVDCEGDCDGNGDDDGDDIVCIMSVCTYSVLYLHLSVVELRGGVDY